jgi:hypothetical protein
MDPNNILFCSCYDRLEPVSQLTHDSNSHFRLPSNKWFNSSQIQSYITIDGQSASRCLAIAASIRSIILTFSRHTTTWKTIVCLSLVFLTPRKEHRFRAYEDRVLRKTSEPKGGWRILRKGRLHNCTLITIIIMMKCSGLAARKEMRNAYRILAFRWNLLSWTESIELLPLTLGLKRINKRRLGFLDFCKAISSSNIVMGNRRLFHIHFCSIICIY